MLLRWQGCRTQNPTDEGLVACSVGPRVHSHCLLVVWERKRGEHCWMAGVFYRRLNF